MPAGQSVATPSATQPIATGATHDRIPSLDGLRALSIVLVLVGHIYIATEMGRPALYAVVGNHQLGVSVFFVISGFIITHLLLREEAARGRIGIGGFYLRRAFRILPAYYLYLLAVLAFSLLGDVDVPARDFASAVFFLRDYMQRASGFAVSHTWSLAVEEHFYLLYPLFLVTVAPRRRIAAMAGTILAGPFLRVLTWAFWPGHGKPTFMFHTRMDFLAGGCLVALLLRHHRVQDGIRRAPWGIIRLVVLALLFVASPLASLALRRYEQLAGYTIEIVLIGFLLVDVVNVPESWLGRLLNTPIAVHIGRISFSLYLWQQLFVYCDHKRFLWLDSMAVRLALALLFAELSYRFVEQPFLEWRRRLIDVRRGGAGEPHRSTNTPSMVPGGRR
jgi:peptidoglycan/LPS O-acetylase OafA/YrhL